MDQVRRKTNATSAYQRHLTGKGVTVAFLDTGISMHPDLQGRILAFRDFQNGKKISVRRQWARHTCGRDLLRERTAFQRPVCRNGTGIRDCKCKGT